MGSVLLSCMQKSNLEEVKVSPAKDNFFAFEAIDNDGKLRKMSEFKNKKCILVVNVACKCGLTSDHYKQLVEIYKQYKSRGFEILAFPTNDFMEQEPWDNNKIKEYVQTNFNVDFQLFDKIQVNGENCHEIYKFLRFNSELHDSKTGKTRQIPWNFAKFLINPQGKVVKFVSPKYNPEVMIPDIEAMLDA
ncbi:phospholipid hydroperoxide glutathione peroxidase (macronuclear) [Tetrahymena thermophila SB210]|uniref:Glutathione peroxidase n=1 Tax=Tetrahymena thermophila (strain SB210) TaxID=312017 RepID=Q23DT2_TETTS|nr:phospholipid hydroperoxide glutathione peroxidase [Tetrahymena thermophila SB210]EAR94389.1 phospholipid hydroperoxide glutathione peroxidase [Tetrahymena thermophila SB210]|eukprot:XP_001014604.1 phospholipid hydroperoxide glutathione peroxidase [Tetrahymena thermophila SB210]